MKPRFLFKVVLTGVLLIALIAMLIYMQKASPLNRLTQPADKTIFDEIIGRILSYFK